MLKRLLTSAAVACTLFGVPALADYIRPSDDHIRILKAVQSKGIVVSINDREACDHETSGMYSYGHTRAGARYADFIVCQDNGRPGGPIASWTENDLDTIRHEAAHIIQDCIDGKIANMSLDTVFDDPKKLAQFAQKAGLTGAQVDHIIETYADEPRDVIMREIEAHAVAKMNNPGYQAQLIMKTCSNI